MIYTNIMITVYAADVAKVRLIMAWYDMKIVATERPEENEKIVAFSVLGSSQHARSRTICTNNTLQSQHAAFVMQENLGTPRI